MGIINTYSRPRESTTTSKFFDYVNNPNEQALYNSLTKENVKMTGVDVYYIPRKFLYVEPVLGEPKQSTFDNAYKIEAYIEDNSGYQGESDVMTKFGLAARDEVTFILAKDSWRELNIPQAEEYNRPKEGDLIFIGSGSPEFSIHYFEITYVNYEHYFYQLGKTFSYKLNCVAFTLNHEEFKTNVPEIDQLTQQTTPETELTIADNLTLTELSGSLRIFNENNPFDI